MGHEGDKAPSGDLPTLSSIPSSLETVTLVAAQIVLCGEMFITVFVSWISHEKLFARRSAVFPGLNNIVGITIFNLCDNTCPIVLE